MIQLSSDDRRKRAELKRELRALERPAKEAQRAERKAVARAKPKRDQRIAHDTGKQDRGRVRDNAYLAYTRRQPCILKGIAGECEGPVEATHVRFSDAKVGRVNPGASCKPSDKWVLPACSHHHKQQHARGDERAWWSHWGIDASAECIRRYAEFKEETK